MITLTTFRMVPPFAAGYVRDLRVRWALEEAGLPYMLRLIDFDDRNTPAYRREQPFGQIPLLQDGAVQVFESGAILMHLGERCTALMPPEPAARTRVATWMFAALNSVEPYFARLAELDVFFADAPWAAGSRPVLEEMALTRLHDLDRVLAGRDWLAGDFSAADILMTTVLRLLDGCGLAARFGNVSAYMARCMARPAFRKALAAQLALYAPAREMA
ncbi:glutathione S-transferase family protein [Herbaspirillum sp. SJZ107]|uniref:glutathione S-transferase family protein n=1 Tax=Herbaspirillum sp. SJZ107 TaxID=2572881 RepID=UPI00114E2AB1|nr:glutathione S-transferase family protein [Herbaspirillum sp. SJZ107]TQK02890.1 glutathione S-transferase [Herbaspirillum sp. SJZ107]